MLASNGKRKRSDFADGYFNLIVEVVIQYALDTGRILIVKSPGLAKPHFQPGRPCLRDLPSVDIHAAKNQRQGRSGKRFPVGEGGIFRRSSLNRCDNREGRPARAGDGAQSDQITVLIAYEWCGSIPKVGYQQVAKVWIGAVEVEPEEPI